MSFTEGLVHPGLCPNTDSYTMHITVTEGDSNFPPFIGKEAELRQFK